MPISAAWSCTGPRRTVSTGSVSTGSVSTGSVTNLRQVTPAPGFVPREVARIRGALAELPGVLVLVVDDFHYISNPAVLESFGQLLDHQPPQLRLVLATRADPALRLHRLRVNGEVTDVRAHDLEFVATEAADLFARNGMRLSDGQLLCCWTVREGGPLVCGWP